MEEILLSAGIDIGTTTTQVVFSKIIVEASSGFGQIPDYKIKDKEIVYRSRVYLTPLIDCEQIDGIKVKALILEAFKDYGIEPKDVDTGAVIITGESASKSNSEAVLHAISEIAGDFVSAIAGPDLEGVLAGKGAGSYAKSKETGKCIVNFDIGGGTTNICVFEEGQVIETFCLDIGGRLVQIDNGEIIYVAKALNGLIEQHQLDIAMGDALTEKIEKALERLSELMIGELESVFNQFASRPEMITFSGGVAACMASSQENDYRYGDIGVLLANAIMKSEFFQQHQWYLADETVNATVIGAGNHSLAMSGSTIDYQNIKFPLKNIPVAKIECNNEQMAQVSERLNKAYAQYHTRKDQPLAIAFKGIQCPTYIEWIGYT